MGLFAFAHHFIPLVGLILFTGTSATQALGFEKLNLGESPVSPNNVPARDAILKELKKAPEKQDCPLGEHGEQCSGDLCKMGKCSCRKGRSGESCMIDTLSTIAFDLDCTNMGEEYVSSCLKQTHGGSCPDYRLVWDKLCYRTCIALPGILCSNDIRESYCANSPECPGLCLEMSSIYCEAKVAEKEGTEEITEEETPEESNIKGSTGPSGPTGPIAPNKEVMAPKPIDCSDSDKTSHESTATSQKKTGKKTGKTGKLAANIPCGNLERRSKSGKTKKSESANSKGGNAQVKSGQSKNKANSKKGDGEVRGSDEVNRQNNLILRKRDQKGGLAKSGEKASQQNAKRSYKVGEESTTDTIENNDEGVTLQAQTAKQSSKNKGLPIKNEKPRKTPAFLELGFKAPPFLSSLKRERDRNTLHNFHATRSNKQYYKHGGEYNRQKRDYYTSALVQTKGIENIRRVALTLQPQVENTNVRKSFNSGGVLEILEREQEFYDTTKRRSSSLLNE